MTLMATDDEIIYELEPDIDFSHLGVQTTKPRLARQVDQSPWWFLSQYCTSPLYSLDDARMAYAQPLHSATSLDQWV